MLAVATFLYKLCSCDSHLAPASEVVFPMFRVSLLHAVAGVLPSTGVLSTPSHVQPLL